MDYVNHNGKIVPAEQPLFAAGNRWLKQGDAVFERFRVFEGMMPFLSDHVKQLEFSITQLDMQPQRHLTAFYIEKEIGKLLTANGLANADITITIYRAGSAASLLPASGSASFLIEANPVDGPMYQWEPDGLNVGVFHGFLRSQDLLARLNTPNRLLPIAAAKDAAIQGWDETIILNEAKRPVMFSDGDLLAYHEGKLKFPVYSEGAPPAILREHLLPIANRMNINHQPAELTMSLLENAGELMHVHPILGLRYVRRLDNIEYGHELTKQLFDSLLELLR